MISYLIDYTPGNKPVIKKVFTATSGEVFVYNILFQDTEEVELLSHEQIYMYLGNLLQYIKDSANNLSIIGLDDENDGDGWHLNGGWAEMDWANNQILLWWEYIYYKDLPELEEGPSA